MPGIEFEGRISESKNFDLLKCRRFNHNLVAQRIAQNARLSAKRTTRNSVSVIHDCPMAIMSPIAPKIHGYQAYATFHDTSMEHEVMDSEMSMPMTLYFAINAFLCPEIVFSKLPWRPPKGFIISALAMTLTSSIFLVLAIRACSCLSFIWLRQFRTKHVILRETVNNAYLVMRETVNNDYLVMRELRVQKMIRISTKWTRAQLFGLTTLPSSILTQAFASKVIPFNTDSSFWVCDNSATGHICNRVVR